MANKRAVSKDAAVTVIVGQADAPGDEGEGKEKGMEEGETPSSDFSIRPDARYFVEGPNDLFEHLKGLIDHTAGGVFGLTGVRGAGKSVLLNRVQTEFRERHFTLQIPAPVSSSQETAFLSMLFREVCQSVVDVIDQKFLKKPSALDARRRSRLRRWLFAIVVLAPAVICAVYAGVFATFYLAAYAEQFDLLTIDVELESSRLTRAHEDGIKNIFEATNQKLITQVEQKSTDDATRRATDIIKALSSDIDQTKDELVKARNRLVELDQELNILSDITSISESLRDRAKKDLAALSDKGKLDLLPIPHFLVLLRHIDAGGINWFSYRDWLRRFSIQLSDIKTPQGEAFLQSVDNNVNKAIKDFVRSGLSGVGPEGNSPFVVSGFKQRVIKKILSDTKVSQMARFDEADGLINNYGSERLRQFRLAQAKVTELRDRETALTARVNSAQTASINREAGTKAKAELDAAQKEFFEAQKAISTKNLSLSNGIKGLTALPRSLRLDFFHIKTWADPRLPAEKPAFTTTAPQVLKTLRTQQKELIQELRQEIFKRHASDQLAAFNEDMVTNLSSLERTLNKVGQAESRSAFAFRSMRNWGTGPLIIVAVLALPVILFFALWWIAARIKLNLRAGDLLSLREISRQMIDDLDYEITRSRDAGLTGSGINVFGFKIGAGEQHRGRAYTLPGLTAKYLAYIRHVQSVFERPDCYGSKKITICIDELDKITDADQVGNVLREIKGAMSEKNCFYLLSISEDAVKAFERRLAEQRDIFESTFDEIICLERLDLDTCVKIARKRAEAERYGAAGERLEPVEEAVEIAAALSTGVPREFLRNVRVVKSDAGEFRKLEPAGTWRMLYRRKVKEHLRAILTSASLEPVRTRLIGELRDHLADLEKKEVPGLEWITGRLAEAQTTARHLETEIEARTKKRAAAKDQEAHRLEEEIDRLGTWLKFWAELAIHLLARKYSLQHAGENPDLRFRGYAQLLAIYADLSYSLQVTIQQLEKSGFALLRPTDDPDPVALEATVAQGA